MEERVELEDVVSQFVPRDQGLENMRILQVGENTCNGE